MRMEIYTKYGVLCVYLRVGIYKIYKYVYIHVYIKIYKYIIYTPCKQKATCIVSLKIILLCTVHSVLRTLRGPRQPGNLSAP